MPRRSLAAAIAAALAMSLTLTTAAADEYDVDSARDALTEAEGERDDARQAVADAQAELDRVNLRMDDAHAELATITEQLEQATDAAIEAEAASEQAAEDARHAEDRLDRAIDAYETQRDDAQDRVVVFYKHGRTNSASMMMRTVAGSGDLHELAVSVKGATRVMDDDRQLTEAAADTAQEAREARAAANEARRAANVAARQAANERALADRLHEGQQRVVAEIAEDVALHQAVLEELEDNEAAVEALVEDLAGEVEELERLRQAWDAQQAREVAAAAAAARQVDLPAYDPTTAPDWASRLPAAGRPWAPAIERAARNAGIDPRLLAAVVWAESNFRADAVSHAGAIGLAQLMPATARGLGVDPWNPEQNLAGAARYLRQMSDQFGTLDLALAAYNAGPGNVRKFGGIPPFNETRLYVVKVSGYYNQIAG